MTQEHLPNDELDIIRSFGLSQVVPDSKIWQLKIRVSVVRFRPWPPFFSHGHSGQNDDLSSSLVFLHASMGVDDLI